LIGAGEGLNMDRRYVGVVFGFISGAYAVFHSSVSFFFAGRYFVSLLDQVIVGYLVSLGLGILVLSGALFAYRGRRAIGGALMFGTSLVDLVTSVISYPLFIVVSPAVLFAIAHTPLGMLGGILILSSHIGTKQDKVGQTLNCFYQYEY
jgi:hypothetical protein